MKHILIVAFSFLLSFSCKNAVQPNPSNGPDTTSHSIVWQIDTLGDGSSSRLHDVVIINDTLAYAVGEIWVRDSLGVYQYPPYNFAKWNGRQWEFSTTSDVGYGYGELFCIYAFGPDQIWVGSSIPEFWDGQRWIFYGSTRGYNGGFWIRKIWGRTSQNIFFAGDDGRMMWRNNDTWRPVQTNASARINDMWENNGTILFGASDQFSAPGRSLHRLHEDGSTEILPWTPQLHLNTIWFMTPTKVFVGGGGLYVGTPDAWKSISGLPNYFSSRIRGIAENDIFVVGAFGLCGHYSGATWRSYPEASLAAGSYQGLAVSKHLILAVGFIPGKAVILRGKR